MIKPAFKVKFWGVRGTVPRPGLEHSKYGGNTSSVEVICGDRSLLLDAGTGLYPLSLEKNFTDVDILLSHSHLDHIQGFPFFMPLYHKNNTVRVWSGHLPAPLGMEEVVDRVLSSPIFPLTLKQMQATIEFKQFKAGEEITHLGWFGKHDIKITTFLLNHPDHATAYRIEFQGKSVCYVTDVEHTADHLNTELVEFIQGTDIFIYDSTYGDEQYLSHKGWGHSTWQEGVRLAKAAKVKKFIAFHHAPECSDAELDKRQEAISLMLPGSQLAKERMELEV